QGSEFGDCRRFARDIDRQLADARPQMRGGDFHRAAAGAHDSTAGQIGDTIGQPDKDIRAIKLYPAIAFTNCRKLLHKVKAGPVKAELARNLLGGQGYAVAQSPWRNGQLQAAFADGSAKQVFHHPSASTRSSKPRPKLFRLRCGYFLHIKRKSDA